MPEEIKEKLVEEEIKSPIPEGEPEKEPPQGITEAEFKFLQEKGYTADEIGSLSQYEREGLLDSFNPPDKPGVPLQEAVVEEIPAESLEPIAGEDEEEVEVEVAKGEPPARLPDEELIKFRPAVAESELSAIPDDFAKDLQAKLDELEDKFDASDITRAEYNKERDKINREIMRSEMQLTNQMRENKAFEKTQAHFWRNRPEYIEKDPEDTTGKAFTFKAQALYGAISKAFEAINNSAKYAHLHDIEKLVEADRQVKQAFGMTTDEKPKAKDDKPAPIKKPPAKVDPAIKSLTDVPASAENIVGSDWAQLDKLTGLAYEKALSGMSDDMRERYLNSRH